MPHGEGVTVVSTLSKAAHEAVFFAMKRWVQRLFLALVCISASVSAVESATAQHPAGTPPGFGDFPVASHSGSIRYATKIILTSPQTKRYRTAITNAGKMEPDFAGHYRVAIWGCGTDCRGFAIVDLISGGFIPCRERNTSAA